MRPRADLLVLLGACVLAASHGCGRRGAAPYVKPPVSFAGSSADLKQTVIVPTLDTPMPAGKNVVWCASFVAAWQRLNKDVLKAPAQLDGATLTVNRLNAVRNPESNLPAGSFYSAAGRVGDGILTRIRADMRDRFPDVPPPRFAGESGAGYLVGYAYLAASARFPIPYFENSRPLRFHGSGGKTSDVGSFGLRHEDADRFFDLRKQAWVLYAAHSRSGPDGHAPEEFAIELCRSGETQVVAAVVPRGRSLAATITDVDARTAGYGHGLGDKLGPSDTLLVPNMNWRIDHHFQELEGRRLQNSRYRGMPLVMAEQDTAFRLDRSGADLKSQAKVLYAAIAQNYVFDRPFLLFMRQRGAKAPFFAIWVDNAELLSRPAPNRGAH